MNNDKYGSPDLKPDCAAGQPALHEFGEAMDRTAERKRQMKDNPYSSGPDDWEQRNRDYQAIEHGLDLLSFGGGGTIEPGDATCQYKK